MPQEASWRPHPTHGKLAKAQEQALPATVFAFPVQRLLPLTDEGYVRAAIEGFTQLEDVPDEDLELAFANIRRAAHYYHVPMSETDWRQLGARHVEPGYRSAQRGGR